MLFCPPEKDTARKTITQKYCVSQNLSLIWLLIGQFQYYCYVDFIE